MQRDSAAVVPALCRGGGGRQRLWRRRSQRDILFAKENIPFGTLGKRKALIGSFGLERLLCLRNGTACARRCRVRTARRFDFLLLSAVAQPLAALLPYGCGTLFAGASSADLVEVRTNSVYWGTSSMRRAQQCRYFARSLPPKYTAPHDSKARLKTVTTSVGFMAKLSYTAPTLRSA